MLSCTLVYRMNKQALLTNSNLLLFHTGDLSTIWGTKSANTLYTTIKRFVQTNKIFRIQKGLYSLIKPEKVDPLLVSRKLIKGYCYLSLETVLFQSGFRSQRPFHYSFVGEKCLILDWNDINVKSHQLADKFLYNDTETFIENNIRQAKPLRAICDALYFNPLAHFDKDINWKEVTELQNEIGYPISKERL